MYDVLVTAFTVPMAKKNQSEHRHKHAGAKIEAHSSCESFGHLDQSSTLFFSKKIIIQ